MNRRHSLAVLLGAGLAIATSGLAFAQQGKKHPMWGKKLLTEEERNQFHLEMRNAKTDEERAQLRAQHKTVIQTRAKEQGIEIPPNAGGGHGKGHGMGQGMGQGKGRGKGQGMNQGMGQGKGQAMGKAKGLSN